MYLALPGLFKRRNRIRGKPETFFIFHEFALCIRGTRFPCHVV